MDKNHFIDVPLEEQMKTRRLCYTPYKIAAKDYKQRLMFLVTQVWYGLINFETDAGDDGLKGMDADKLFLLADEAHLAIGAVDCSYREMIEFEKRIYIIWIELEKLRLIDDLGYLASNLEKYEKGSFDNERYENLIKMMSQPMMSVRYFCEEIAKDYKGQYGW